MMQAPHQTLRHGPLSRVEGRRDGVACFRGAGVCGMPWREGGDPFPLRPVEL
jgi:hypothetical protein